MRKYTCKMKFQKYKNIKKSEQPVTVSTLRKNISKSYIGRLKIRFFAIPGRFKRFYREYKLPTIATIVFLLVIISLSAVRQLERTSLLALINDVTGGGQRYSSLLSSDQVDEFIRNDTSEQNVGSSESVDQSVSESAQSNSTPFSLENNDASSSSPAPTNTGTQSESDEENTSTNDNETPGVPSLPFESSIASFSRNVTILQCSNPSKRNKGSCSKVYSFNSDINTFNGPGSVSYSWQSNIASGNGNGNFSVGMGSSITSVSKQVTLGCNKDTSFTLQLAVLSPNTSSSNTITINHNCNEI
jgi:hypothetical protein